MDYHGDLSRRNNVSYFCMFKSGLDWVWVSLGMAMFAAFTSTIMDSGAEGASPTVVEAAEGRLHNGGWEDSKHSHTTIPR